ncbi:MMPL family transporter [Actinomadura barringtoniae]|uniref:MMPL family transporter n=1 Tax=Actinomadura barringtoniae TaxID=1427535 RepID=A0A939PUQ6_9ACTN|nr:MMPL family transporter [Actinomadura barringtoniae]MBO2455131.1 MMPL family transporter [Actinomadura barringtoniae]
MFESWGRLVHRRRRPILGLSLIAIVFMAVWGTGVFGALTSAGGFDTPGSESDRAAKIAEHDLGRGQADVVVLYKSAGRTVDDPSYRQSVDKALGGLPSDKVAGVSTYWTTKSPQFVSKDRTATYAVLQLAGGDEKTREDNYKSISKDLTRADALAGAGLTAKVGGDQGTQTAVNERVSSDIGRAEGMAMPVLLILLVVIFGSLVAASLPLLVGGLAVLGSFTALRLLTEFTDVSIFAINITTFLGLGLAIDYGLFVVGRFREELARGKSVEDALAATMSTAGRTVAVSGITVAVSLSSLLLFDQNFLISMGYGGIATVLVCMIGALTVLPAMLAVLGPRVNALAVRRRKATSPAAADATGATGAAVGITASAEGGRWLRLAHSVMRRPVIYAVATIALLLALGSPFLRISWGGLDARVLPTAADARVVSDTLQNDFPRNSTDPIEAIVTGTSDQAAVKAYSDRLAAIPGINGASITGAKGQTTRIALTYDGEATSSHARSLAQQVRDVTPPPGADSHIGGESATVVDQLDSLGSTLPWLVLWVGTATFVLLFLAFGSVVLPLKAMLMNLFSLSAAFGAMVWIFQDGHLSGVLDFTATGTIAPAMPILMLAMLFGLSMDYELFLLSRIREQYDLTGDNTTAVATGLQRTGGIITSAAALFIIVIGAFSTSGIAFIKMTGVIMAIGFLVDATIVRALLVPATMRLLGNANWWAPGPLARVYRRYGIRESDGPEAPGSPDSPDSPDSPEAPPKLEPAQV